MNEVQQRNGYGTECRKTKMSKRKNVIKNGDENENENEYSLQFIVLR